jgi:hypothetical protein
MSASVNAGPTRKSSALSRVRKPSKSPITRTKTYTRYRPPDRRDYAVDQGAGARIGRGVVLHDNLYAGEQDSSKDEHQLVGKRKRVHVHDGPMRIVTPRTRLKILRRR